MTRPHRRHLLPLAVLAAACAAPPAAPAQSGGVEAGEAVLVAAPAYVGRAASLTGVLADEAPGRRLQIELLGAAGDWTPVAATRTGPDGRFKATWRAPRAGRHTLRARPTSGAVAAQTDDAPTAVATVYRRAGATWYDQAGTTTACGVRLGKRTIGAAHRTLPCGTRVEVRYGARTLTVPVIDRGPFVAGVHYDLTLAAARILGFVRAGRVRVGVLPAPEAAGSALAAAPPAPAGR